MVKKYECKFLAVLLIVSGSIAAVIALAGCPEPLQASFHYVSPTGNDAASGTFSEPWKTLQKAAAESVSGDTIFLRGGTYVERLIVQNSGTAQSPIVFMSYPGERAVLDGTGLEILYWWGLIDIRNKEYIEIRNIDVEDCSGMGIAIDTCKGVLIDSCRISDTFISGIFCCWSQDIEITNNEVVRGSAEDNAGNLPPTNCSECISVKGTRNAVISDNTVHGGKNEGIDLKDGCSDCRVFGNHVYNQSHVGIYVGEWASTDSDIEVYNNTIHDCHGGISVATENGGLCERIRVHDNYAYHNSSAGFCAAGGGVVGAANRVKGVQFYRNYSIGNESGFYFYTMSNSRLEDIHVFNNIVAANVWIGIGIWGPGPGNTETTMYGINFINNTIVNNGSSNEWGSGGITGWNFIAENLIVRNNLLYGNANAAIAIPTGMSGLMIDHNGIDYSGFLPAFGPGLTPGSDVIALDPAAERSPFESEKFGDYRPVSGSAVIDSGSSIGAPGNDLNGVIRPQGNGIDLGAYELP